MAIAGDTEKQDPGVPADMPFKGGRKDLVADLEDAWLVRVVNEKRISHRRRDDVDRMTEIMKAVTGPHDASGISLSRL